MNQDAIEIVTTNKYDWGLQSATIMVLMWSVETCFKSKCVIS